MNHVRKVSLIGIALVLALAVTVLLGSWALAAVSSSSGTTRITMMIQQTNQSQNQDISVSAQLTDAGKPLVNEPVEFDVAANFFGQQQVNIGTAQTDITGTATILYQPSWDGTYEFTAHFMGDGNYPHIQVTRTLTYSGPVSQYTPNLGGLKPVREWVTPVIYGCIGLFWLLLILIGVRTLRGISRSRSQA